MATSTVLPDDHRLRYTFDPIMLQGATANVIMQLALKPVGYGVIYGKVDSGNVFKHPIKRLRTTLSYLAVATLGTEEEINAYREAVNEVHEYVRSQPGAEVKFNAFNKDLQLWVAACLYMGFKLGYEAMHGEIDEDIADYVYDEAAKLGTSLQVTQDQWPADRAAFDEYWEQGLAKCEIDDVTREYLWSLTNLKQLPAWARWPFVRLEPLLHDRFSAAGAPRPDARRPGRTSSRSASTGSSASVAVSPASRRDSCASSRSTSTSGTSVAASRRASRSSERLAVQPPNWSKGPWSGRMTPCVRYA